MKHFCNCIWLLGNQSTLCKLWKDYVIFNSIEMASQEAGAARRPPGRKLLQSLFSANISSLTSSDKTPQAPNDSGNIVMQICQSTSCSLPSSSSMSCNIQTLGGNMSLAPQPDLICYYPFATSSFAGRQCFNLVINFASRSHIGHWTHSAQGKHFHILI